MVKELQIGATLNINLEKIGLQMEKQGFLKLNEIVNKQGKQVVQRKSKHKKGKRTLHDDLNTSKLSYTNSTLVRHTRTSDNRYENQRRAINDELLERIIANITFIEIHELQRLTEVRIATYGFQGRIVDRCARAKIQ